MSGGSDHLRPHERTADSAMSDYLSSILVSADSGSWGLDHWDFHWEMGPHGRLWWVLVGVIVAAIALLIFWPVKSRRDDERVHAILEGRDPGRDPKGGKRLRNRGNSK